MKIILASKSGVRKDILDRYKIANEVIVSNVDEDEVKESLLEEGADPDELEDRIGDFPGDEEQGSNGNEESQDGQESAKSRLKKLLKKKMIRDPELYEFSEYLLE